MSKMEILKKYLRRRGFRVRQDILSRRSFVAWKGDENCRADPLQFDFAGDGSICVTVFDDTGYTYFSGKYDTLRSTIKFVERVYHEPILARLRRQVDPD